MTKYEKLLSEAEKENVTVYENYDFSNTRFKGLYCDGSVALSKELRTDAEKNTILQEELGHHHTTSGNILDLHDERCMKQERTARVWAYNNAIGISGLIASYKDGCRNRYEIAEYLGVTEDFLQEALNYYKSKYGLYTVIDNYAIYFEPLCVLELYK